jgi:hypothetical protein
LDGSIGLTERNSYANEQGQLTEQLNI